MNMCCWRCIGCLVCVCIAWVSDLSNAGCIFKTRRATASKDVVIGVNAAWNAATQHMTKRPCFFVCAWGAPHHPNQFMHTIQAQFPHVWVKLCWYMLHVFNFQALILLQSWVWGVSFASVLSSFFFMFWWYWSVHGVLILSYSNLSFSPGRSSSSQA